MIGALTDVGVAARRHADLAALDLVEIVLEVGDRRLLDELEGVLIDRIDAGLEQIVLRAAADLGDEHRRAVVDRADDRLEAVFLAIAALAIEIDAAMTDELRAAGAELVDLELLGVTEVLVDAAAALGRDGDQDLDVARPSPASVFSSAFLAATFAWRSSSTLA